MPAKAEGRRVIMFTRKTTGWIAAGLALVGATLGTQVAKAEDPIARPAILTTSDDDASIQLVRHGRRGGWGRGYGYYRPYRWGGYRPYRGYSNWAPGYSYGYPAYGYGYGYSYPSYNYYNPGFGVYFY
jgi:hypothetical protein